MTSEEEPLAEAAYNELAATYEEVAESGPYNANLEFPETTSLIPNVTDKRVLDAGCGCGRYTEWLLNQGADVVGVDVSEEMIKHATERIGDQADFHKANLGKSFDFAADDEFDGIVSSLVLDYINNWEMVFSRFARILESGGFFVFSVRHPLDEYTQGQKANYFEVELREADWEVGVPYYRRSFSKIINPLLDTGFQIDVVSEPQPTEAFRETCPDRYEKELRQPVFLCLRAVKM